MRLAVAVLLLLVCPVHASAQSKRIEYSIPPPSEWMHIDGSKNPEMIPEWSVWQLAFNNIFVVGKLPTAVSRHVTKEEAAAILEAAREQKKNRMDCEERGLKLRPLLGTETIAEINRRTEELNLECRWQTLRLRDRVLESLGPDAQAALRDWVESSKATIQVSVPKAELDFYLKPK
jgi:hypothetical protein